MMVGWPFLKSSKMLIRARVPALRCTYGPKSTTSRTASRQRSSKLTVGEVLVDTTR